jgi:Cu(I)-responsive transcriptional regulator
MMTTTRGVSIVQKPMTIGQVAREAGIGVETIRYYEREGLLDPPARRPSGYRQYAADVVARLRFIRQAQRLGFTLREIRELLELRLDPRAKRAQVRLRAKAKLADIDQRIEELRRMKQALTPLIKACDGIGTLDGCPILAAIDSAGCSAPAGNALSSEKACHGPRASRQSSGI